MDSNDAIQAKPDSSDLETLLQEGYGFTPLKRGQVCEGTIVSIRSSAILVDLGSKTEGIISGRELERMPRDMLNSLNVGDQVLAYVVNPEDKNGNIVLSLTRAQLEKDWREAERLYEKQDMFAGTVAGFNKGGLIVRLGKVRGFVPASQLASSRHSRDREGSTPEDKWGGLVGETLQLKVIEIDRERNRLILSERAAMREWRKAQKEKLLSELKEGEIREGEVISIADFGAFVDLGGADGLIHLSELSWKRVNHPREALKIGDRVKVYVLNVDRDRRRIGLSLKRLQPDPWTLVEENYRVDQLVEGQITKLAKFGAFACILGDEEIEGLIHISELSDGHIAHPKEVVQEGQVVTLRIIRIDPDQRRMGLSLKRVDQAEYADLDWQAELAVSQEEEEDLEDHQAESVTSSAEEEALQTEAAAPSSTEMPQDEAPPDQLDLVDQVDEAPPDQPDLVDQVDEAPPDQPDLVDQVDEAPLDQPDLVDQVDEAPLDQPDLVDQVEDTVTEATVEIVAE